MKWLLIIGGLLLLSLYGNDVVLGILATVIIVCIFAIVRIKKKQKQQKAKALEQAQAQLAAEREAFEKEREAWKQKKEAEAQKKEAEEQKKEKQAYKSESEIEAYPVKGVFAHENEIFHNLMQYNPEYDYSKADMIEHCVADVPIYKWTPKALPVTLVPEPNNPYDPNAVRIEVAGILIGYIPKNACKKVLEYIKTNRIMSAVYDATGGAYKTLVEDYDPLTDKSQYTVETGRAELSAEVYIKVRAN